MLNIKIYRIYQKKQNKQNTLELDKVDSIDKRLIFLNQLLFLFYLH